MQKTNATALAIVAIPLAIALASTLSGYGYVPDGAGAHAASEGHGGTASAASAAGAGSVEGHGAAGAAHAGSAAASASGAAHGSTHGSLDHGASARGSPSTAASAPAPAASGHGASAAHGAGSQGGSTAHGATGHGAAHGSTAASTAPPSAGATHAGSHAGPSGATAAPPPPKAPVPGALAPLPQERHFASLRQLTFGGQNAEAYFSGDEARLVFQSERPPFACDQIFTMNAEDGSDVQLVSTGRGRTTCAYYFPSGARILYSTTHLEGPECPQKPDFSKGYVWPVYPSYDIVSARPDGSDVQRLTRTPGYDAEATISPDGSRIVFTSARDGDLDLYVMDANGRNVQRLTDDVGYDGGAFFSHDGTKIVYRAHHPRTIEEADEFRLLLHKGLVRPTTLEIYVMNADGTGRRQVTDLKAASFAPFMHPDGKRIIFSTNLHDPKGRDFDLYIVNTDGTGLERVTHNGTFDGFPMFTRDGKRLVFASNRNGKARGETNVFLAEWQD